MGREVEVADWIGYLPLQKIDDTAVVLHPLHHFCCPSWLPLVRWRGVSGPPHNLQRLRCSPGAMFLSLVAIIARYIAESRLTFLLFYSSCC